MLLIALQLGLIFMGIQGFESVIAEQHESLPFPPVEDTPEPALAPPPTSEPAPVLGPEPAPTPTPAPVAPGTTTTTTTTIGNFYTGEFQSDDPSRYSLDGLINTVLPGAARWIAGFLGAIAVLFLIWAGIQFLTAEGDPDKISQATKTAFYVIAGVLLVMFASALVYLFLTIFSPA